MSNTMHVYPVEDLIEHNAEEGGACICGPRTTPVKRDDGSMAWVVTHHSLDGRELTEEDAT